MSILWKRILLISAALLIAAGCAYWADRAAYQHFGSYDAETDTRDIFTDGSEAYGMNSCELTGGSMKVTGGDPYFYVNTYDHEFSRVHILFKEPADRDVSLQIFYAPGGIISESNSLFWTIHAGQTEDTIPVPMGSYALLRFDIEEDVNIRRIYIGSEGRVVLEDKPNAVCIGSVFCVLFIPLCAFILIITGRKERQRKESLITRKPFPVIVFSNLFLSTTILFFQPLNHLLANTRTTAFPVWNIWWIQLLVSIGVTLILSAIMLLLPKKAGWIAATLSLGIGISFLIQSLLFNIGWPFDMSTKWEMKVGNILIWLWIVLFVVTTTYYFLEKQDKRTMGIIAALACLLIMIQAANFIMLATINDTLARRPDYLGEERYQQYVRPEATDLIRLEEKVINVSMNRGMPYLIKDGFYDLPEEKVPEM